MNRLLKHKARAEKNSLGPSWGQKTFLCPWFFIYSKEVSASLTFLNTQGRFKLFPIREVREYSNKGGEVKKR